MRAPAPVQFCWVVISIIIVICSFEVNTLAFKKQGQSVFLDLPGFGPIVGQEESTFSGNSYHSFKGLPYSKAGRFEDFVAPQPWAEVYNATEFSKPCFSPTDTPGSASEDCLYINVYTSNINFTQQHDAPVLVFIHGGAFIWGQGDISPDYFMDSKLVMVAFNYRIGPFGFLHSPDPAANITGNYGLKDQIQALHWVQQTIHAFGGNPNNVTLWGLSAGAASVHYLMLAPDQTGGLFYKAITTSGTALCPWALQTNPNKTVTKFLKVVGCLDNIAETVDPAAYECLRAMDGFRLSSSWLLYFTVWNGPPFTFVPVVDGELIKDHPKNLLASGKFLHIPWLGTGVRDEGSIIMGGAMSSMEIMSNISNNWLTLCPLVMEMGALSTQEAARACRLATERYLGSKNITFDTFYNYLKMGADRHFDVPMQKSAEYHSKYAPFYGYRYDYQSPVRGYLTDYYDHIPDDVPRMRSYVPHADDFIQLAPDDRVSSQPVIDGDPDEFIHKLVLGIYLSFINTGVPTIPETVDYDLNFPRFSPELPSIQVIDKYPRTDTYIATPSDLEFWDSLGL